MLPLFVALLERSLWDVVVYHSVNIYSNWLQEQFCNSQPIVGLYWQPFSGLLASSFEVSRSHTTTRHSQ